MKLKSPEKEALIYQTVMDITFETGLSGLKIAGIAKRAGLAHGTIYIYYKNKKDLINSLYRKAKRSASSSILHEVSFTGDFQTALKSIWEQYLGYHLNNKREMHFMQQCAQSAFMDVESQGMGDEFIEKLSVFFEQGKKDRQVKNMELELIFSVFSGLAKEITEKVEQGRLQISEALLNDSFELCWNAIRR